MMLLIQRRGWSFYEISDSFSRFSIVCECGKCCSLIVENQNLLYQILCDLTSQLRGEEGKIILSHNNRVLQISKSLELFSQFVPFELNKKILINKVINRMQKLAMDEEHYYQTNELIILLESYLLDLSVELTGDIEFSKITWENIIKAVGIGFTENYDSLAEKILDYMELVREYDSEKMFITLNLRSYISDDEMNKFVNDVVARGYKLLMVENSEYPIIEHEKRYIIDADKCIIC